MTPLIDRYLHNVRLSLSSPRRDDIVRELAEDIRSQVADREEELGRSLTDAEQDALLKKFGHPLALATRYGPQRHVIGPALFPVYWMTLKIALGGALAVNVALAIAFLVNGQPIGRALGHLGSFPFTTGGDRVRLGHAGLRAARSQPAAAAGPRLGRHEGPRAAAGRRHGPALDADRRDRRRHRVPVLVAGDSTVAVSRASARPRRSWRWRRSGSSSMRRSR